MECDFPKSIIQVQDLQVRESMLAQEYGLNLVRIQEPTLIQKLKLNHKIGHWGHIHVQVQFHLSDNLSICQKFSSGQVQDVVIKLPRNHDSWVMSIWLEISGMINN